MKKFLSLAVAAFLTITAVPAHSAAIAAGQKCIKLNQSANSGGKKLVCVKSGNKLVWKAAPAPKPKPTATQAAVPTPTQTPEPVYATLWEKYKWSHKSKDDVIATSTNEFLTYISTQRSPNQVVKVVAQDGVDPILKKWVEDGANLVAHSFAYPALSGTFYDVIALDSTWLASTYKAAGVPQNEIDGKVGAFNSGNPAFGGTINNTWNMKAINQNNLMVVDKAGMAQTAGHEFYHAIQENSARTNPGPDGSQIPNWIWEGPAVFVGLQSAAKVGAISYLSEGRAAFLARYANGNAINRTSPLSDIKANDGKIDPYAIGFAATELIVANVGVEKFNNIYLELGKGKSFSAAFESATGVPLADFYTMFEEVRGDLGFARS